MVCTGCYMTPLSSTQHHSQLTCPVKVRLTTGEAIAIHCSNSASGIGSPLSCREIRADTRDWLTLVGYTHTDKAHLASSSCGDQPHHSQHYHKTTNYQKQKLEAPVDTLLVQLLQSLVLEAQLEEPEHQLCLATMRLILLLLIIIIINRSPHRSRSLWISCARRKIV